MQMHLATGSVITLFLHYNFMTFFSTVWGNINNKITDYCSLTAVTDNLFMHSALPPATKTHSSYMKLNYKKK